MLIYKTTNLINGKIYIGQKTVHKGKLINSLNDLLQTDYYGSSKALNKDIKEFGTENFRREVLEEDIQSKEELNAKETEWNLKFNATNPEIGYNISKQSYPFFSGCKHTEESKKKQSISKKGKTSPNKGKITSEETKKKISDSKKGKNPWNKGLKNIYSKEVLEKMSKSHKNHLDTKETKLKKSEGHKGNKNGMYNKSIFEVWEEKYGKEKSIEMRLTINKKRSITMQGKNTGPKSEETKKNMSIAQKNKDYKISEETREKLRSANLGDKNPMAKHSVYEWQVIKYGKEEADRLQYEQYKNNRNYSGNKNPNYGKGYYKIWVDKYGQEEADRMKREMYEKQKETKRINKEKKANELLS